MCNNSINRVLFYKNQFLLTKIDFCSENWFLWRKTGFQNKKRYDRPIIAVLLWKLFSSLQPHFAPETVFCSIISSYRLIMTVSLNKRHFSEQKPFVAMKTSFHDKKRFSSQKTVFAMKTRFCYKKTIFALKTSFCYKKRFLLWKLVFVAKTVFFALKTSFCYKNRFLLLRLVHFAHAISHGKLTLLTTDHVRRMYQSEEQKPFFTMKTGFCSCDWPVSLAWP